MTKKNNIIEEIQELVQQIKNEYQEGVDFEFVAPNLIKEASKGFHVKILSPQLKKFCREKFDLPPGEIEHLDYEKGDPEGNDLYYRIYESSYEYDILDCAEGKLYRFAHDKEKPKKCKNCGKLTSYEKGQVVEWGGKNWAEIFGYLHPKCAKRYFSNKEPISEMKARHQKVKEILLRNLDKICLDPKNYLANIEYLKTDGAEEEYEKAMNSAYGTKWRGRYMKLVIEGEELDLEDFSDTDGYYEVKRELVKKIKSEIKQNPSEWIIEPGKKYNYDDQSRNQLVKHQPSGRRHWKVGISEMRGKSEWKIEAKQDWAEIETLINGSSLPVDNPINNSKNSKINDSEREWLKSIFQKYHIEKIIFEKNSLFIDYDKKVNSIEKAKIDNKSFQELREYCKKHNEHIIDSQRLGLSNNTSTNSEPNNKDNHKLVIGLSIGVGITILIGLIAYFVWKKRNKK